jgi:hypothetical protein
MADRGARRPQSANDGRASVTSTLGGCYNTHNRPVVDVEAPGNTRQAFLFDVPSPNNLAWI